MARIINFSPGQVFNLMKMDTVTTAQIGKAVLVIIIALFGYALRIKIAHDLIEGMGYL